MRIDIITVLPELLESPLNFSIVKRARDKGLVEINVINLRDFTTDKYKTVDDYVFGGGAGMVMMIEPVYKAIEKLKSEKEYDEIINTSPDGEHLTQKMLTRFPSKTISLFLQDTTKVSTSAYANILSPKRYRLVIMFYRVVRYLPSS